MSQPSSSIQVQFDGENVWVTKKGLNNPKAIAVLEIAKAILMKHTLGDIKVGKQGEIVSASVPSWRPDKTA